MAEGVHFDYVADDDYNKSDEEFSADEKPDIEGVGEPEGIAPALNKKVVNLEGYAALKTAIEEYYSKKINHLSNEQWRIIQSAYNVLHQESRDPRVIFIDGPVGSGKTEVVKILSEYVVKYFGEKINKKFISGNAIVTASYGVAALNYKNGNTAHSSFGFPLDLWNDTSFWYLDPSKYNDKFKLDQLEECSLIVIDDVSALDYRYIHMLDRSLKRLMRSEIVFGGKIVIFVGDFRQLPPVVEGATMEEKDLILNVSPLISCNLWPTIKTLTLSNYYRALRGKNYSTFLEKLGLGLIEGQKLEKMEYVKLIPLENIKHTVMLDDIIKFVYSEEILKKPDLGVKRTIQVPRNKEATEINNFIVNNYLHGSVVHCYARDSKETTDCLSEYQSILDTLHEDKVFPDFDLQLKKGALCMIIRSMYKPTKLINGTKIIVEDILDDEIIIRKPGKSASTKTLHSLKRLEFVATIRVKSKLVTLKRVQFPIRVCYATTIHKNQGQNLVRTAVDLRVPPSKQTAIFRHGQLLSAFGRVRNFKDIMVLADKNHVINNIVYTHNVVFPELVQHYVDKAKDVDDNDENMEID